MKKVLIAFTVFAALASFAMSAFAATHARDGTCAAAVLAANIEKSVSPILTQQPAIATSQHVTSSVAIASTTFRPRAEGMPVLAGISEVTYEPKFPLFAGNVIFALERPNGDGHHLGGSYATAQNAACQQDWFGV